jgi:hypothetical protein
MQNEAKMRYLASRRGGSATAADLNKLDNQR